MEEFRRRALGPPRLVYVERRGGTELYRGVATLHVPAHLYIGNIIVEYKLGTFKNMFKYRKRCKKSA